MWQCPKCGRDFKKQNQSHYCANMPDTIDGYIAVQPEEVQPVLNKIRKTIKKAAPKAIEKMSWRMPTFWQDENLIHFAVFKKHIGIYPGAQSLVHFEQELSGYKTTKGAIQFPLDKPVNYNLIAEITKYRVSAVENLYGNS
jgi:uncharacterized protein YdhG (YjbR/CyaY superfamily)